MGRIWKQRGYNCAWPYEIETWKWGEKIPEWLSDKAGIEFMDGEGNITLKTRNLSKGGVEILEAGSSQALVRLESKEDLVYISLPRIGLPEIPPEFSPTPFHTIKSISLTQLNLLYEPI